MNSLACQRINWASVAYKRPERLANIMPNDEIGDIVLLGGFVIDDNELCARAFRHHRKAGGWPYDQRGTDGNEQVALRREFRCAAHGLFGHRLTEGYRGRLHRLVARRTVRRMTRCLKTLPYPTKIVTQAASDTARIGRITVQLDHVIICEA